MASEKNNRGGVQISQNDIVILVAGRYGVGKSSFVRACVGSDSTSGGIELPEVRDAYLGLPPQPIAAYPIPASSLRSLAIPPQHSGRRLVLVDTPGFDHESESTASVQRRIGKWVRDNKVQVTGIIYLAETKNYSDLEMKVGGLVGWFERVLSVSQTNPLNVVLGIVSNTEISSQKSVELRRHWEPLTARCMVNGRSRMEIGVKENDGKKALNMVQKLLVDLASEGVPATPMPPSRMEQSEEDTHDPKCCGLF